MFVPDYSNAIPGYTGHRPANDNNNVSDKSMGPKQCIPGYGGYVPGIKSENVFGKTYGKTSVASAEQSFPRGIDQEPNVKFQSIMKGEFIDHSEMEGKHKTTAQLVGVHRAPDVYKKVSLLKIV